jgi:hypothetical protein
MTVPPLLRSCIGCSLHKEVYPSRYTADNPIQEYLCRECNSAWEEFVDSFDVGEAPRDEAWVRANLYASPVAYMQGKTKMNYGFDLDGTLTRPAIAALANTLYAAGHGIYIITGGLADTGAWTMEKRKQLLFDLGVSYTEIIRCLAPTFSEIAQLKAQACKDYGISVMFDDMDVYLNAIQVQRAKVL